MLNKYLDLAFIPLLLTLVNFFRLNIVQPPVTIQQERLDAEELFSECFDKVVKEATSKGKRLIIFIDNLDRLSDHKIVEALESLKTYINNERCIFVVACDDNVVRSVINSSPLVKGVENNRIDIRAGEHYLDKFFQQTFRLPEYMGVNLHDFAVKNFQTTRLYDQLVKQNVDIRNLISIILPSDVSSPRKVKRLLNEFIALYEIAKRRENEGDGQLTPGLLTNNLEFLGKFSTIRTDYPDFYQCLIHDTGLLATTTYSIPNIDPSQTNTNNEKITEKLPMEAEGKISQSLISYLTKTQTIMVDDVEPYIWLSQDILALGLKRGDLNQLRTSLSNGEIDQVKNLLTNNENDNKYKLLVAQIASRLVELRLIGIEQRNGVKVLSNLLPEFDEEIRPEIAHVLVKLIPQWNMNVFSTSELLNLLRWAKSGGIASQSGKIIHDVLERLKEVESRQQTFEAILQNSDVVKDNNATEKAQQWLADILDTPSQATVYFETEDQNLDNRKFAEWFISQAKNYSNSNMVIDDYYSGNAIDYILDIGESEH